MLSPESHTISVTYALDAMSTNGSVFAGVDTFFGPVYLAAGFAEQGRTNFYLFIGTPPR